MIFLTNFTQAMLVFGIIVLFICVFAIVFFVTIHLIIGYRNSQFSKNMMVNDQCYFYLSEDKTYGRIVKIDETTCTIRAIDGDYVVDRNETYTL